MVFLYCNLQNIILGLRTEAVVKKGDGDTLSDWKPSLGTDGTFVITKMINDHPAIVCGHKDDQPEGCSRVL